MREITVPDGCREIEEFRFVLVSTGSTWRPALLERWWRLPDGTWACRIRTPGHRAARGRTTHARVVAYDPQWIRPLTSAEIRQ